MPRATKATAIIDESLPGLNDLDQDPQPAAGRRGPGRPRGSKTAPVKKIAHRAPSGKAMSKDQLKRNVAVEMYGFASMFAGILGMKDPDCVSPAFDQVDTPDGQQERLAAIVDRTVNLLARSDKVLSGLATTGIIGEIAMLGSLLIPWGRQVWQAHGPNGHGHKQHEEGNIDDLKAKYPAPALA
jgi:hypothetical protein